VQEFPLKSALDPAVYGDPTSAIAAHHIEGNLEGLTVDQVLTSDRATESHLALLIALI
jgi:linoleate 9S-lipoxygenase